MKDLKRLDEMNLPSTQVSRGGATQTGNPVINIGMRDDLESGLQQKGDQNLFNFDFMVGNIVKGKDTNGKTYRGKIIVIDKHNKKITIQRFNGKKTELDFTTCIKLQENLFDGNTLSLEKF